MGIARRHDHKAEMCKRRIEAKDRRFIAAMPGRGRREHAARLAVERAFCPQAAKTVDPRLQLGRYRAEARRRAEDEGIRPARTIGRWRFKVGINAPGIFQPALCPLLYFCTPPLS